MNPTTIVNNAINNTRKHEPAHWQTCLENRAGAEAHLGSYFPRFTAESLNEFISQLVWEPYTHSDVLPPAQAFIARKVPGRFGMVQVSDVPDDAHLEWVPSKEKGKVEVVWLNHNTKGIEVDFAVILIGPSEHGDIVWTFHPGDPIKPSTADEIGEGFSRNYRRVSKREAAEAGIKWVKLG